MKTYLEVPFSEKDEAKSLGARFDMSRKQWYVPDGLDLWDFEKWFKKITLDKRWNKNFIRR